MKVNLNSFIKTVAPFGSVILIYRVKDMKRSCSRLEIKLTETTLFEVVTLIAGSGGASALYPRCHQEHQLLNSRIHGVQALSSSCAV